MTPSRRGLVVIGGALAQRSGRGGHAWVFLQYLLGFRRLGFDVLFLDRLEREMCVGDRGNGAAVGMSADVAYLADVMRRFDLGDSWHLFHDGGHSVVNGTREGAMRALRDADLFLNVMGYIDEPALLEAARRPVFLDIDPGFAQHWQSLGQATSISGHRAYVTVGSNVGDPTCTVPTCGVEWLVTRPPVVLEAWPVAEDGNRTFTSVVSWRGPFDPIETDGRRLGLRAHSFRPLVRLPTITGLPFELALDIDEADAAERLRLEDNGWRLVDPRVVAADPRSYEKYVRGSAAEIGVAKELYVITSSGWFSDRSACFLASGKPVLVQDTGFAKRLPTGRGVVSYTTLEEAAAGALSIWEDYRGHATAARELAEEFFDSDRVLTELIDALPG